MAKSPPGFDYNTYLASREWSLLREQVRERSGNRCEHCCAAPQQAVHHLTYAHIGNETLGDLLAVCNPCHAFLSAKSHENPLEAVMVVSPEMVASFWKALDYTGEHFLLPLLEDGPNPQLRYCRGAGCIWCGYADDSWTMFLGSMFRRLER